MQQLLIFYLAGLMALPLYIGKQYFFYESTRYFPILIPGYVLFALSPLLLGSLRNRRLASAIIAGLGIGLVIFLIAFAGGDRAPGAFWLTGIPMVLGVLLGVRGVVAGAE